MQPADHPQAATAASLQAPGRVTSPAANLHGLRVGIATEDQHESLIDLLSEVHAHYHHGAVVDRTLVRDHLLDNLLGRASPHRLVVASSADARVVGLAAITLVYSLVDFDVSQRRQCQLKELYVTASERGRQVGRALMSFVARHAVNEGCSRIDWPVQAANARGIAFYERLGAGRVVERLSYRLGGAALRQLAEQEAR